MILILADSTDPWGVALARHLTLRGEPYVLQDPGQMRASMIDRTADWAKRLTGVYRGVSRPFCEDVSASEASLMQEPESDWLTALNAMSCPVVNRLSPGGVPACPTGSPAWEAIVSAHGFQVPAFSAAMNRDEVLACLDLWGSSAYVKPVGFVHGGMVLSEGDARAYTGDLAPDRPVLLAPVSPGHLVSLFVVGEHVAATVVRSVLRSRAPVSITRLGLSLLQQCSDLVLTLGLVHAECLLSLSADGQITCLDVVASPNYWTCPREAQQQVVSRVAGYLTHGERSADVTRFVEGVVKSSSRDWATVGISEDH